MKTNLAKFWLFLFMAVLCMASSGPVGAKESAGLLEAKQEAEARGFAFVISRDEIIAQAGFRCTLETTVLYHRMESP